MFLILLFDQFRNGSLDLNHTDHRPIYIQKKKKKEIHSSPLMIIFTLIESVMT